MASDLIVLKKFRFLQDMLYLISDSMQSTYIWKQLIFSKNQILQRSEAMIIIRQVVSVSAVLQLIFFVLLMLTGTPGIYSQTKGLMYISNSLCHAQVFALFFMLSTIPTWLIMACSVSMETRPWRRRCTLWLIAIPFPAGIGILLFNWCVSPVIHYVYVIVFVVAVSSVHISVAGLARHFIFLQRYFFLMIWTAVFGISFLALAMSETSPGIHRNIAVIAEYCTTFGFILLNSLAADRIHEHVRM
jgi:hypothetical protein